MQIAALYVYPIKSCKGFGAEEVELEPRGPRDDRRLMLTDPEGRFLTQREHQRMALITPRLEGSRLTLEAPGMAALTVRCSDEGHRIAARIWRDTCAAIDQGDEAAAWLGAFLGTACRLTRIAPGAVRQVDQQYAPRPSDQVGFADGFPLLLIAEASLDDLNSRLETPLGMERFRPNIVVSGCPPYAEDGWRRLLVGGIELAIVKPCARCAITATDQDTAERGKEPLRTLATYRAVNGNVMFGQNVVHDRGGTLRVGAAIEIIE